MFTDAQALRLLEDLRQGTQSLVLKALLDWVLARLAEREVAIALSAKPKVDRREYLRIYMRDYRAGKRRVRKNNNAIA
jgi:hypothetical protein